MTQICYKQYGIFDAHPQIFWSLQLLHHFRTYNNALVSYYATSTDQKMAYRQRIANLNAWSCPALKNVRDTHAQRRHRIECFKQKMTPQSLTQLQTYRMTIFILIPRFLRRSHWVK